MDRKMEILAMYDLPRTTSVARRRAQAIHKEFLRRGYCMLQESVYVKLLKNGRTVTHEMDALHRMLPENGNINAISMTLNVFKSIKIWGNSPFNLAYFAEDMLVL